MHFADQGTVQVIANGVEIVTFEEGNYFGEIGVLHRTPRSATCLAVTDCEVFVLKKDALEEVSTLPQFNVLIPLVALSKLSCNAKKQIPVTTAIALLGLMLMPPDMLICCCIRCSLISQCTRKSS